MRNSHCGGFDRLSGADYRGEEARPCMVDMSDPNEVRLAHGGHHERHHHSDGSDQHSDGSDQHNDGSNQHHDGAHQHHDGTQRHHMHHRHHGQHHGGDSDCLHFDSPYGDASTQWQDSSSQGKESNTQWQDSSSQWQDSSTQWRDTSSQGRDTSSQGRDTSSQGRDTSSQGRDTSSQGRDTSSQWQDTSTQWQDSSSQWQDSSSSERGPDTGTVQTSQPGDGQDRTQVSPPEQAVEDVSNIPWTPLPDAGAGMTLDAGAIRGVNLSGAEWGKNGPNDSQFWPTAQELDYYKSKGMNSVRLPISWEQFQPQLNGQLDPNEMNRLLNFLHEADARGMKVVLDLQNFDRYKVDHGPFGQGVGPDNTGTVVGQPGVPVSALADFWSKMVRTVDADPSASAAIGGWDLMNEPHDDGKTWVNTATQVVDAIRATGDQHTIIVEGDEWARDFTGFESLARSDKNIVFSAHSYWDDGSGGYSNQNPAGANVGVEHIRDFVNWLHQNNAQGFVGEWGVPTNNPAWDPAVTNFLNYLKANNVGHMVWSGGPGWNDYGLSVEPSNGQDKHLIDLLEEID